MTTKEQILGCFKDINHAYNDCTRYDTLKCMLDELQKPCKDCQYKEWLEGEDCPAYEKKTGRWILARTFPTKLYDEYLKEYECSECYRRIRCTESQLVNYPYCHCGAKMLEVEE